jgi:hypothetical protein
MKFSQGRKIGGDVGLGLNIASMFIPGLGEIKLLRYAMNFQNDLSGIRQDITGVRDILKGDVKAGIFSIGTGILSTGGGGLSHYVDRGEGFGGLATLGRTDGGSLLGSYRSMTSASAERKLFTETYGDVNTRIERGKEFYATVNSKLREADSKIRTYQDSMVHYNKPLDDVPSDITWDKITDMQNDIDIAKKDTFIPNPTQSDEINLQRQKMYNSARKNFIKTMEPNIPKYTRYLQEGEYQDLVQERRDLEETELGFRREYIGRTEFWNKFDEEGLKQHFKENELYRNLEIKKIIFRKTLIISAARTGAYAATITNNYAITNAQ